MRTQREMKAFRLKVSESKDKAHSRKVKWTRQEKAQIQEAKHRRAATVVLTIPPVIELAQWYAVHRWYYDAPGEKPTRETVKSHRSAGIMGRAKQVKLEGRNFWEAILAAEGMPDDGMIPTLPGVGREVQYQEDGATCYKVYSGSDWDKQERGREKRKAETLRESSVRLARERATGIKQRCRTDKLLVLDTLRQSVLIAKQDINLITAMEYARHGMMRRIQAENEMEEWQEMLSTGLLEAPKEDGWQPLAEETEYDWRDRYREMVNRTGSYSNGAPVEDESSFIESNCLTLTMCG